MRGVGARRCVCDGRGDCRDVAIFETGAPVAKITKSCSHARAPPRAPLLRESLVYALDKGPALERGPEEGGVRR